MSLHVLEVEPRDVAAEALGLLLGAPAPRTLASCELTDAHGNALSLGVLGASHVVTAAVAGELLTEQVSCDALAAGGEALPTDKRSAGYALTSSTEQLSGSELAALAASLRATSEGSDAWVCGAFPGSGSALTALTGQPLTEDGWSWQTWHLYPGPGSGTVVRTSSRWAP